MSFNSAHDRILRASAFSANSDVKYMGNIYTPETAVIDTVRGMCSDCERPEVVVEDHGAYVVVAEVAPDA